MPFQTPIPAAEVRRTLEEVLARPELRERQDLLEPLRAWFRRLGLEPSGAASVALQVLLVLAVVLAALAFLRRHWRAYRFELEPDPAREPALALPARLAELRAGARAARARGDLAAALRLTFQALLLALGGRGDLEFRAAWTNRELLRRGRVSEAALRLLEPLVRELEPKEFGGAPIEERDLERLEALLEPHLGRGDGLA